MSLRSLGQKSDLLLHFQSGDVTEATDYVVVRTPDKTDYYWGNYLIFYKAPEESDAVLWTETFDRVFSEMRGINHRSLTWDVGEMGDPLQKTVIKEFEAIGYEYSSSIIHKTNTLDFPDKPNQDIVIKPIENEQEWKDVLDMQVLCWGQGFEPVSFREFKQWRVLQWRKMAEAGMGRWFGAFKGDTMVADAGVYWGEEFANFQNVETHPDHRKQGIASTLVHHMGKWALEHKTGSLVIDAEEDSTAMKIYQSLGFKPIERIEQFWMCWD